MNLLLPCLLPLLQVNRPCLPVNLLHLLDDRFYLHPLYLFKDKKAGHGYMTDIMTWRSFDGNNVAHFKPQIVDVAVETLPGILKPYFYHLIVPGVIGQTFKPVEFIKLVCAPFVFYYRFCRFFT